MDTPAGRITRRRPSATANNPPEPSPVAVSVVPPRRIAVAKRHVHGRAHLASVLNWWLNRSDYSHSQIGAIADWALGQDGWLISSQISHLRNNHVRQPSFTNLEALGAANELLACWHLEGARATFHRYGPYESSVLSEELLDRGIWLKHPQTEEPLNFEGFCSVFVGRLKLPYANTVTLSGHEAKRLSEELGILLDQLAAETGLSPRDAITEVLRHYPVEDRARVARLRSVLLGFEVYSQSQVETELFAISELVAGLRGLPEGTYGPQELYAELTRHRQRT
jgi:hypothetical protein